MAVAEAKAKKQFRTPRQPRRIYDRKVLKYGASRTLALSKVIPESWQYVRIRIVKKEENRILVSFEKLLGAEELAQATEVNKGSKSDAS
jgi:hypothetical protein